MPASEVSESVSDIATSVLKGDQEVPVSLLVSVLFLFDFLFELTLVQCAK